MKDLEKSIGLKTRHVFLDTEVYRRFGHNLNSKVLQTFLRAIRDHECTLHITDITRAEIDHQIREMAEELVQVVNKGRRELKRWETRSRWGATNHDKQQHLDARALAEDAIRSFNLEIKVTWAVQEHKALAIPADKIFEQYFRRDPPFDKKDSKEFPDAFVVTALDQWCQAQHQKMYVVTRDGAMLRAIEKAATLISLPSLDDLLQIIVEAQHPEIIDRVQKFLDSPNWDSIDEKISDQLSDLGTVYSGGLLDGEIIEHDRGEGVSELLDFHVISVVDKQIEVVAKISFPVAFTVQYEDTTYAFYDKEDDEYIGAETETAKFEQEVSISTLVVFDLEDGEIIDVDVLTRDIYLEEPYEDYK
jgi:hypothetical protein